MCVHVSLRQRALTPTSTRQRKHSFVRAFYPTLLLLAARRAPYIIRRRLLDGKAVCTHIFKPPALPLTCWVNQHDSSRGFESHSFSSRARCCFGCAHRRWWHCWHAARVETPQLIDASLAGLQAREKRHCKRHAVPRVLARLRPALSLRQGGWCASRASALVSFAPISWSSLILGQAWCLALASCGRRWMMRCSAQPRSLFDQHAPCCTSSERFASVAMAGRSWHRVGELRVRSYT